MKVSRRGFWGLLCFCVAAIGVTGCFGPPSPQKVFGASGKQFTAPDLCGALVECKNSGEAACYYDYSTYVDPNSGKVVDASGCKKVTQ
jgi:hypothetical protein